MAPVLISNILYSPIRSGGLAKCGSLLGEQDLKHTKATVWILAGKDTVKEMLGQEKRSDVDMVPSHHPAIFSSDVFFILLPSLAFIPHNCSNVADPLETSPNATLEEIIQGSDLANLVLTSFTIWCCRSGVRFINQRENMQMKNK